LDGVVEIETFTVTEWLTVAPLAGDVIAIIGAAEFVFTVMLAHPITFEELHG